MFVLIVDGAQPPEDQNKLKLMDRLRTYLKGTKQEPKRLDEGTILSLVSRACSTNEVNKLIEIGRKYQAEWTAVQGIHFHEGLGWVELLQYRPGLLAATILDAQKKAPDTPLSGSFQRAVASALEWPLQKVLGFQMGVSQSLLQNPSGVTDAEFLNGMALGYMFHESKAHRENNA